MTRRRLAVSETLWIKQAACGGEPVETFFLVHEERYKPGRFDRADEICHKCPVKIDCDDFATRTKERWGVWAAKDRGEAKHAQRVEKAEELLRGVMSLPGSEAEDSLRVALADEAASGRPDALGA